MNADFLIVLDVHELAFYEKNVIKPLNDFFPFERVQLLFGKQKNRAVRVLSEDQNYILKAPQTTHDDEMVVHAVLRQLLAFA